MHYIGLIRKYNPIITNQELPQEYHGDTLEHTLITVNQEYIDNQKCKFAQVYQCSYANNDNTCPYIDNCPIGVQWTI